MEDEDRTDIGLLAEVLTLRERVQELEAYQTNLREIEERYRCIFERSPECIYIQNLDGTFLDANQPALDLFGYTREELLKIDLAALVGEHQLPLTRAIKEEILRDGHQGHAAEYCLRRKNGEMLCVEACAAPLYRNGRPYALLGVLRDISEWYSFEKALQESERNFRALAENASAGILVIAGEEGRIVYANRITLIQSGYELSEIVGKSPDEVLHPETYVRLMERYIKIISGEPFPRLNETEIKFLNGRCFPAEVISARTFWREEPADMIIVHDITERLRAQEEKTRILKEKAGIVDAMGDGLLVADMQGIIINTNPAYECMSGLTRDEIIGSFCLDLAARTMQPEDLAMIKRHLPAALNGDPLPILSCTIIRKDGAKTPLSFTTTYTRDKDGKPQTMILVMKDMTDRKLREDYLRRARVDLEKRVEERTGALLKANTLLKEEIRRRRQTEQALSESEELHRSLVEHINEIVFRIDTRGIFTYVSDSVERISGYTPAEIIGQDAAAFVLSDDVPLVRAHLDKRFVGEYGIGEYRVCHKNGQIRWVQASTRPIMAEERLVGLQGIVTDITPQKILQERLILAERLAATGQLASSIAHEINSPLQAITVTLSSISSRYPEDQVLKEHIDLLHAAFESIRDTVRNLLDLNRPGMDQKKPADLNAIIRKTVALMNAQMKQLHVKVRCDLAPDLPPVEVAPQQMSQVFLNLINNAIDAMAPDHLPRNEYVPRASGGEIGIKTIHTGTAVIAEVRDTGPGIRTEDLPHIFDPFFTGKKRMGMGIGLAVCQNIVAYHQGTISAGNHPERGAVFTIALPIVAQPET